MLRDDFLFVPGALFFGVLIGFSLSERVFKDSKKSTRILKKYDGYIDEFLVADLEKKVSKLEEDVDIRSLNIPTKRDPKEFSELKTSEETNDLLAEKRASIAYSLFVRNQLTIGLTYCSKIYRKDRWKLYAATIPWLFSIITLFFNPAMGSLLLFISTIFLSYLVITYSTCKGKCDTWRKIDILDFYKDWLEVVSSYNDWHRIHKIEGIWDKDLIPMASQKFVKLMLAHKSRRLIEKEIDMCGGYEQYFQQYDVVTLYDNKQFKYKI